MPGHHRTIAETSLCRTDFHVDVFIYIYPLISSRLTCLSRNTVRHIGRDSSSISKKNSYSVNICVLWPGYTPEALADQVDWSTLPGADGLAVKDAFNMFAGYVTVDEENGRRIFYWFMEAQENAQEAPVVSGHLGQTMIVTLRRAVASRSV